MNETEPALPREAHLLAGSNGNDARDSPPQWGGWGSLLQRGDIESKIGMMRDQPCEDKDKENSRKGEQRTQRPYGRNKLDTVKEESIDQSYGWSTGLKGPAVGAASWGAGGSRSICY